MPRGDAVYAMECIFTGRCTDKAVQIIDPTDEPEATVWLPLSQVEEMHGRVDGKRTEGRIVMSEWIAAEKGLL